MEGLDLAGKCELGRCGEADASQNLPGPTHSQAGTSAGVMASRGLLTLDFFLL